MAVPIFLLCFFVYTFHSRAFKKLSMQQIGFTDCTTSEQMIACGNIPASRVRAFGNTSTILSDHPVIEVMLKRWKTNYRPGIRNDKCKVGLAIEGGGIRGCVAAGATAAINYLGLNDCIDVVYGSSAGAMIGAYFISRQFSGVAIYHDILPAAGSYFINKAKLLRALGIQIPFQNIFRNKKQLSMSNIDANSVINLEFLLEQVMGNIQPLDWETFISNEKKQPLRIITSNLHTFQSTILSRDHGHYSSLNELLKCIRASMLVPGISNGLMAISKTNTIPYIRNLNSVNNNNNQKEEIEMALVDAFLFEPLPFRSAIKDGCTHVIVLRTRPDPCPMLGRGPGIFEKVIANRYFHKHQEYNAANFLLTQKHQLIYANDIVTLNDACSGPKNGIYFKNDNCYAHLLPIAPKFGSIEVSQLETKRKLILNGMKDGAYRLLSIFGPPMGLTAQDIENAVLSIFPDRILDNKLSINDYISNQFQERGNLL